MQTYKSLVVIVIGLIYSCGDDTKPAQPMPIFPRQGLDYVSLSADNFRSSPSLSANGSTILFVSTKNNGTPRVYSTNFAIGSAKTTTQELLPQENPQPQIRAQINPQGNKALVVTVSDITNNSSLHLIDTITKSTQLLISDQKQITDLAFSHDGNYLAYSAINTTSNKSQINVHYTNKVSNQLVVTTTNSSEKVIAFSNNNTLIAQALNTKDTSGVFLAKTITGSDTLSFSSQTILTLNTLQVFPNITPKWGLNGLFFAAITSTKTNYINSNDQKIPTNTVLAFSTKGENPPTIINNSGLKIRTITTSNDYDYTLTIAKQANYCSTKWVFTDTLVTIVANKVTNSNYISFPETGSPTLVSDLCNSEDNNSLLHNISHVAINSQASTSNHRILLVASLPNSHQRLLAIDTIDNLTPVVHLID